LQSFLYATDHVGAPRDFAAADALAARAWKRPAKYVTRNNPATSAKQKFKIGQFVNVGKAYEMGGKYRADEWTGGPYTVVKYSPSDQTYGLTRGALEGLLESDWDVFITEGRLRGARRTRRPLASTLARWRNPAASRCKKCTTKGKCAAHAKAADFGHDKRPAKYKGLRRDAFGYPARWMYPLNTPQRTRAAARFYGQYCDRYPPAMRKELARNIDKAEKRHGIGKYERKRNPKARRRAPRAG
jgi:hypothetical protein